jgi:hypothetical protein
MARASIGKELHCIAKNETGLLGRIVVALSQQKVFILHLSAYSVSEMGYLQLVTRDEDCEKARNAISYFIPKLDLRDVLIVEFENKIGTLAEVSKLLGSNGVGIKYVYGTSSDGFKIVGVFSTDDNAKACELINQDNT